MEQLKRLSSHEYDKMIQDVTHILPMPFLQKRDDDDDDEEAEEDDDDDEYNGMNIIYKLSKEV